MADFVNRSKMKVFLSKKPPFSLQKFYMPDNYSKKYTFQSCALINVTDTFGALVKMGARNSSLPVNCCFIDLSVIVPTDGWMKFTSEDVVINQIDIEESNIQVLSTVRDAENVQVIIVCSCIKTTIKFKENRELCEKLVKDFLNQFLVRPGCIVSGESSPELTCHSVVITDIFGKTSDVYRITDRTKVTVKQVLSIEMFQQIKMATETSMIFNECADYRLTLPKIAKIMRDFISKPLKYGYNKNILLVGPTGCGKSSMIDHIAKQMGRIVLRLPCGDFSHKIFNEELSKIFQTALLHVKAGEPCIVVLKDIDHICVTRNCELTMISRLLIQKITTHLVAIEKFHDLTVVATTTRPEDVHILLKKVGIFNQEIEISTLSEYDRENIFRQLAPIYGFDETGAKTVASWTPGYVLCDFHFLFRETKNSFNDVEDVLLCFKKAVSVTLPSSLRGTRELVTSHKTTFKDIGGLEKVKKLLKMSVQWQMTNPEAFARFGIPTTKGILLYGPPGCAKTSLVKALANEANATLLALSAADLYSCYVGEAEKQITKLFSRARISAPSILFIDEIDALVGTKGGDRNHGPQERILATLLLEMDGVGLVLQTSNSLSKFRENETPKTEAMQYCANDNLQVIVVGATNRPENIDDALKRPGRFDKLIYVPAPDVPERLAILQQLTASMAVDESVHLEVIAKKTNWCSGADLKSICTESALFALTTRGMNETKITHADFEHVISNFRPSLSRKSVKKYI